MASKFNPLPGMYFYTAVNPFERSVEDMYGDVQTITTTDRSYRGDVFYCMATDDSYILAERVFGGSNYEPHMFSRGEYTFSPVGPDIMKSLNPYFKHKLSEKIA
jgi:hypothetical protein